MTQPYDQQPYEPSATYPPQSSTSDPEQSRGQYPPPQNGFPAPYPPGYAPSSESPAGGGWAQVGSSGPPPGPGSPKAHRRVLATLGALVVVSIAVAAYIVLAAGKTTAATPTAAANGFLKAVRNDDLAKARAFVCTGNESLLTAATGPGLSSYSVGKVQKQDSRHATANVTVQTGGASQTIDLPVVRQGRGWRVCFTVSSVFNGQTIAVPALPTPTPLAKAPATSSVRPSLKPSSVPTSGRSTGRSSSGGALPDVPGLGALSGLSSDLSSLGLNSLHLCGDQSDPQVVATAYVAAALTGIAIGDGVCVYQHAVPAATTRQLAGRVFVPDSEASGTAAVATYHFQSISDSATAVVTVTRESDHKYWVTKVVLG
jgi:hypothetical protein